MSEQNGRIAVVTGAAGFIASHITHALVERGYAVRAIDDLTGGMGWLRLDDLGDRIERHQTSILASDGLAAALRGAQVVVHHAALISVPESVERPIDYQLVNATGTLQLLEACRAAGVGRVVYASTSAVYGDGPEQPKRESMVPDPISPYAVSKYAGERYVSAYARLHGMETVCLRYFNVFGQGQNLKSQYGAAVPAIVTRILRGEAPTVYGDGEQTRDFCHVSNVVRANVLAVTAPKLAGEVVNIGCGRRASVNDIVAAANRMLGRSQRANYAAARAGDVKDSLADVTLAKQVLGYEPVTHFEQGLEQTLPWYREQVG